MSDPGTAEWAQREEVWNSALPSREKFVLLAFLDFDRRAHGVDLYPSIERVAWMNVAADSTTRAAVRNLEKAGIFEPVGTVTAWCEARGRVTKYRYHPENLPRRQPFDSRRLPVADDADRRRNPAAVRTRQPPKYSVTADETLFDSRRMTAPQPPDSGGDLSTDQEGDRTKEQTHTPARARGHEPHAWCGRKCVPDFLHDEFLQAIGDAKQGTRRLVEFYARTVAAISSDVTIPEPPVKFWRRAFANAFGAARVEPDKRNGALNHTVPGVEETNKYLDELRRA